MMPAMCRLCRKVYEGKEITHLACVPVEWDEGLENQWQYACWKHEGVEEHANTEETEAFHKARIEDYDPWKAVVAWGKGRYSQG